VQPRVDLHRAVGQLPHRRGSLGVELVGDRADQLAQHVAHRDEAGRAAVLVQHDSERHLLPTHLAQELGDALGLGHEVALARDLAQARALDATARKEQDQVARSDDADHLVERAFVDRDAAVATGRHDARGRHHACRGVDALHGRARRHQRDDVLVADLHHVADDLALVLAQVAGDLCVGDDLAQAGHDLARGLAVVAQTQHAHHAGARVLEQPAERHERHLHQVQQRQAARDQPVAVAQRQRAGERVGREPYDRRCEHQGHEESAPGRRAALLQGTRQDQREAEPGANLQELEGDPQAVDASQDAFEAALGARA
jgi:hypothetical protein